MKHTIPKLTCTTHYTKQRTVCTDVKASQQLTLPPGLLVLGRRETNEHRGEEGGVTTRTLRQRHTLLSFDFETGHGMGNSFLRATLKVGTLLGVACWGMDGKGMQKR